MHDFRDPAVADGKNKFTAAEYLEMEKTAGVKHEFYKGEIVAMSGAGPRHNIIFSNLFGYFHQALFEKPNRLMAAISAFIFPKIHGALIQTSVLFTEASFLLVMMNMRPHIQL